MKQPSCFQTAEILLPDFTRTDPKKWAVVACDQFTSEPEYWKEAERLTDGSPSTLHMFLPEAYLAETEQRLPAINASMRRYEKELLISYPNSMIYTERTQSDGSVRPGVVLAVDLEQYDYRLGASSPIRASEATVLERIPPRVAIRREAVLELPHVMLLIDDAENTVIEPLAASSSDWLYDTDLMLGGGHIRGRLLGAEEIERVSASLNALMTPQAMQQRYGDAALAPLLFAVGDGNHSLATAKAVYEACKERLGAEAASRHPCRYALAEVVNIHSPALKFEPIYRVLFGVRPNEVVRELSDYLATLRGQAPAQTIRYVFGTEQGTLSVSSPERQLTVGTLQDFLDDYLRRHPEASVDYIHGEASLTALAQKEHAIGFLFSGMTKNQLFRTVLFDGALPRKTFSMGHAEDKRYYMECRRIQENVER